MTYLTEKNLGLCFNFMYETDFCITSIVLQITFYYFYRQIPDNLSRPLLENYVTHILFNTCLLRKLNLDW